MKTQTMIGTATGAKIIEIKTSKTIRYKLEIRFDDECNNGHKTFAMTHVEYEKYNRSEHGREEYCDIEYVGNEKWVWVSCGIASVEWVKKHFPHYAKYVKWHLISTDGPMYYYENTLHHVKQGNLEYAKSSAVWPDAKKLSDITEESLKKRFRGLMVQFKCDMEDLGFDY